MEFTKFIKCVVLVCFALTLQANSQDFQKVYNKKVNNYPSDAIKAMNLTKFISFKNRQPSNVGNQNSDDTKEICEYISSRITPQEGSTPKNETLFIVNSAEFAQQVVIETCKLRVQPTYISYDTKVFSGTCVQMYSKYRMVALRKSDQYKAVIEDFLFPSFCKFVIKRI